MNGVRILLREPLDGTAARLFCLPFAGTGASVFRNFPRTIAGTSGAIEVCPIQLPGRENRLREAAFDCVEEAADELAAAITPYLDRPYALFGHCMGGLLAYEMALRFHRVPPVRLYVSASRAPHDDYRGPVHPAMSDHELAAELRAAAAATGVLELPLDLLQLASRLTRQDIEMCARYRATPARVTCPITTISWTGDATLDAATMRRWSDCGEVTHITLAGGHHAFQSAPSGLLDVVTFIRGDTRPVPGIHAAAAASPGSKTERYLAHLWSTLLPAERVGVDDDFFSAGGHSLLAARMTAAIQRDRGCEIDFRAVLAHPTIRQLAALLDSS